MKKEIKRQKRREVLSNIIIYPIVFFIRIMIRYVIPIILIGGATCTSVVVPLWYHMRENTFNIIGVVSGIILCFTILEPIAMFISYIIIKWAKNARIVR